MLPVDQHMLLALMAPRPVYVASAQDDLWADPRGEFLSSQHATEAYRLHGVDEPAHDRMPDPHQPVGHRVGYHLRSGPHDVTPYDWQQFLRFADEHHDQRRHVAAEQLQSHPPAIRPQDSQHPDQLSAVGQRKCVRWQNAPRAAARK